jgi:hypothetical protein
MKTGDLIRGPRGAAALVIETKDDGLHVVTTRGATVWEVGDYRPLDIPPITLLRSATQKAESLTKERDAALAKVETQRTVHQKRMDKINKAAIAAGNSHGIHGPLDQLLRKHGMEGRPRVCVAFVQARLKAVLTNPGVGVSREMNYNAPWGYGNGDVQITGVWSHTAQAARINGLDMKVDRGADLQTDCPCERVREVATPDWMLQWIHANVIGRSQTWTITVEEIGSIWVQEQGLNDTCRHVPTHTGTYTPYVPSNETPRKEVK